MICFPNAKINLGLNIVSKRDDGFHNLETVFYPIKVTDALEIVEAPELQFTSSGINIPGSETDNLCIKTYKSLAEKFKLPPVHIHLHKNIPIGAGLGGGSSDAAFTAKLLNDKFQLGLTEEALEEVVRLLGSDCAFFIKNKPCYAFGKGDQFENIELNLSGKFLLLVYPNIHISTKEAYDGVSASMPEISVREIIKKDLSEWKSLLKNDFEVSILPKYPALNRLKEELYKLGAVYASMSGSGSAFFGIYDEEVSYHSLQGYESWMVRL
jgi:4-diphosphocytidyl-2-C-methyl-D-erythritol kinase